MSTYESRWRARRDGAPASAPTPVTPVTPAPAPPKTPAPTTSLKAPTRNDLTTQVAQAPVSAPASASAPAVPAPSPVAPTATRRVTFGASSNVRAATLRAGTGHVEVEFVNGATHTFGGFTDALLDEWTKAESAGKWFNANVRLRPSLHPQISKSDG